MITSVLSPTLENNFNRLSSMKLQNEMSNTSIMTSIVKRFPRLVGEKWHAHLLGKSATEQEQPFSVFITWISMEKPIWERMVSTTSPRSADSHYVGDFEVPTGDERRCYSCGQVGHVIRSCPTKNSNSGGKKDNQPRRQPTVKKFWCALHKGDKSRKCSSNSCIELRKLPDVQKRIQLLKDNGDCPHCCGDHLPGDCKFEERVCGGGKTGRGCTRSHKQHELFCKDAKVFA